MMFGTYYMPYTIGNDQVNIIPVTWRLLSAQAISVPLTTDPFLAVPLPGPPGVPQCQRNKYSYYLYNACPTAAGIGPYLSPLLIDGALNQTCQPGPPDPPDPFFTADTCDGIYALLESPSGLFDEAAYLSVNWNFKLQDFNIQYSCSIEWFNDVRSNVNIAIPQPDPDPPLPKKFKVMLLGANHTF